MLTLFILGWMNLSAFFADTTRIHFQPGKFNAEVYEQIAFYARLFEFDETVHIHISTSKKFPAELYGFTYYHKDEESNQQYVYIRMRNNLSDTQRRKVIAHEMIHAKQYIRNELQVICEFNVKWKNKAISDFREINYKEREWEREAFSKTSYLVKLFNEAHAD